MKLIILFLIVILSNQLISQQQVADLDITLTFITDEAQNNTYILYFGLDSTATDGLDPWLGEYDIPPDACGGWGWTSCMVFTLPPPLFNLYASLRDYRYGTLPYSGQVLHKLGVDLGYSATQAEMFWDFPEGVSVHLDDLFGGVYFELDMQGEGSFIFTDSLLNIFSSFFMNVTYYDVVPIELTSFSASVLQNEKAIQLNWTTATETNNSGFEINRKKLEARSQESKWETIGFVPGFGTTTEPKSYSFVDENVSIGIYKYRLKQIDFDGSFEYLPIGQAGSNEIEVEVDFTPKEFVLYQNYPNPFNPTTIIKYEIPNVETHRDASLQMVILKVYDLLGNEVATLVNEEKQPGVYEVEFNSHVSHSGDVRYLTSGIYFYQLSVEGPETSSGQKIIQTKKMILAK